jgi:type VI secretion system secreted protein Hcp
MKPKLSQLLALAPAALAALAPLPAGAAAVDYFLKIEGVDGESTTKGHEREILLDSFTFGAANTVTVTSGGAGGAGKATFSDMLAGSKLSKVSPKLYLSTAAGTRISNVQLSVRKSGATFDFYTIKLSEVYVTSVKTEGRTGEIPTESMSLNFGKVTWTYTPTSTKGTADTPVAATWDLKASKGS